MDKFRYVDGQGFVGFSEEANLEMMKAGIGQPPRVVQRPVVQQPIVQQPVIQQPVVQQQVDPAEKQRKVEEYLRSVGMADTPVVEQVQTPIVNNQPKQNDSFSSWFGMNDEPQTTQYETPIVQPVQAQRKDEDNFVVDYRKKIVNASVEIGYDPAEIESTIARMTPEEHAVFAAIKLDQEKKARMSQQSRQPIVFKSLEQRPPVVQQERPRTITSVPAASASFRPASPSSVLEEQIRNKFYKG